MRARADALDLRVVAAGATETMPIAGGLVVRNAELSGVRFLNIVCLLDPLEPGVGADEVTAIAERWLGDLAHRALRISDETCAERVAPGLIAAGWERRRTALMVRPGLGGPELPVPDPRAREAGEAEHTALMRAVFSETEYGPGAPPDLPGLLVAAQHAQQAGMECRRFAAGEDHGLQSMCELFLDRDVDGVPMAMVEQVATLALHRERGLAKAVTAAAMTAAVEWGAELIVVPADREDWPQLIYAGLGCDSVGTVTSFFRSMDPPGGGPRL